MMGQFRSVIGDVPRWTPFTFVDPSRYVERGPFWRGFDLRQWSRNEYEWKGDGWNGYRDIAKRPSDTVESGVGDCEDYAIVAASWALEHGRTPVRLGFCWEAGKLHPTHAVCYDAECVYSSGTIHTKNIGEYLADSAYSLVLGRVVK